MGRLITIIRGAGIALLFLVIALCLAITIVPPFLDRIYYDGPVSRHYDGAHFFNPAQPNAAEVCTIGEAQLLDTIVAGVTHVE